MNFRVQLSRESSIPLQDQLVEQLRRMILEGTLKPNSRVIATRFLAEQIGVSRTTVLLAYERLISEGYFETRPAVGTFVAASPPTLPGSNPAPISVLDVARQAALRPTIFTGSWLQHLHAPEGFIDFRPDMYEGAQLLPPKLWFKGIRSVFESAEENIVDGHPPAGVERLRQAIADHLAVARGLIVSAYQVIIVTGPHQARTLITHLFQRRNDAVVVESPCEDQLVAFLEARKAVLVHVPVDENGIVTEDLPDHPTVLAYVSPARQNPLGGTLPLARRKSLIEWARKARAYLVEDDSDGDMRYFGNAPPPLMALDPYGLVFHIGSFIETLGAGIGLGYLVVPSEFTSATLAMKSFAEGGQHWVNQMVIAELMTSGQFDSHLRRLRKHNLERRDCLIEALHAQFGDIRLIGTEAGARLTWILPEGFPDAKSLSEISRAHGVILKHPGERLDGSPLSKNRYHDCALILGYGHLNPVDIRRGVERIKEALSL